MGGFRGKSDYHYQCLRVNVDMLKIIQIGVALFNKDGQTPAQKQRSSDGGDLGGGGPLPYAWQFNFKFSLENDMANEHSIGSLQEAGIDFQRMEVDGIDPREFAAMLIPSGLVCFDDIQWISFHGGYDFGYLAKLLLCDDMPADEFEFDRRLKMYFPSTWDVKYIMKHAIKMHNSGALVSTNNSASNGANGNSAGGVSPEAVVEILQKIEQKGSLEHAAETLGVKRIGPAHQAGSDALLTGGVFFAMRHRIFRGTIPDDMLGKIWGLTVVEYGTPGHVLSQQIAASAAAAAAVASQEQPGTAAAGQNGAAAGGLNGQGQQQPSTPNITNAGIADNSAGDRTDGSATTGGGGGGPGGGGGTVGGGGGGGMGSLGPMTPGGGGGVFGSFAFAGSGR